MTNTLANTIENASAVTEVFGHWPDFHDAEVHAFSVSRDGSEAPSIEARIHVFEMTPDVDDRGHLLTRDHRLVTLFFANVAALELDGFNEQNVLFSLSLELGDRSGSDSRAWKVAFEASYGLSARFSCDRVVVRRVELFGNAV